MSESLPARFLFIIGFIAALPIWSFAGLIQSEAVCASTFTWSQNEKSQSPCLVAAYVSGACESNEWTVPALNPGNHYDNPTDNPNRTKATLCTCSWAAYNLFSACTACQGIDASIPNWDAYKLGCTGMLTNDTYFPSSITLSNDTAIPYWAGKDPSTWSDHHFDVIQAKSIAEEEHSDFGKTSPTPPASPKKSKKSIGPIIGGVVGGVVILVVVIAASIFFICRRQRKGGADYGHRPEGITRLGRSITILSHQSGSTPLGYSETPPTMSQSQPVPGLSFTPTSPTTNHGHSNSGHSMSYFSSAHGSGHGVSPTSLLGMQTPMSPLSREQIIEPFVPGPTHTSPVTHARKRSASTDRPTFEGPSLVPAIIGLDGRALGSSPLRARVNPPAYSPNPGDVDTSASSDITGQENANVRPRAVRGEKARLNAIFQGSDSRLGASGVMASTTENTSDTGPIRPVSQLSVANPDQNVTTRNEVV